MNAEEYIKSKLDGNFWYIDQETHKVVCRTVSKKFIPQIKTPYTYTPPPPGSCFRSKEWTADEDERLLELRRNGSGWRDVQHVMRRGLSKIRARYTMLCAQRGEVIVKTQQVRAYTTWPEELKDRVIAMRYGNMSIAGIASKTSMSTFMIRDFLADCAPDLLEARSETLKKRMVKQTLTMRV